MKINHIRNATIIVEYANTRFLIDPMLGEKGSFPSFPGGPREDQNNPLVDLPMSLDEITQNIDAIILTHLHLDHFDERAKEILDKDLKVFVQNEEDAAEIRKSGFKNIEVLTEETSFNDIKLTKTPGQHGRGEILEGIGEVCGLIFEHPAEQKLYVAGDTVWYSQVKEILNEFNPGVIVINGGDNLFYGTGSLIMNEHDIYKVAEEAPHSKIVVVHMEAVNHWNLSKNRLKEFAVEKNIDSQIFIPNDGDSYEF